MAEPVRIKASPSKQSTQGIKLQIVDNGQGMDEQKCEDALSYFFAEFSKDM